MVGSKKMPIIKFLPLSWINSSIRTSTVSRYQSEFTRVCLYVISKEMTSPLVPYSYLQSKLSHQLRVQCTSRMHVRDEYIPLFLTHLWYVVTSPTVVLQGGPERTALSAYLPPGVVSCYCWEMGWLWRWGHMGCRLLTCACTNAMFIRKWSPLLFSIFFVSSFDVHILQFMAAARVQASVCVILATRALSARSMRTFVGIRAPV